MVPEEALEVLLSSIAPSTFKQYQSSFKQWYNFCKTEDNSAFLSPNRFSVLKFLTKKFKEGSSYGTLNTHRSAISLLSLNKIGEDFLISRFFKGVYRLRPTHPKYTHTWDVSIILNHLKNLDLTNQDLTTLTLKTVMLLALASAHRVQTLTSIDIRCIVFTNFGVEIKIEELIKTSAHGRPQPLLHLPFFKDCPELCVASHLQKYLEYTSNIRNDIKKLFISLTRPHKPVTSQTISRWLKRVLKDGGIDVQIFTAHSTRHASTSTAFSKGIDIETIRKTAGWSENSQVFGRFYNRQILNSNAFAHAVFNIDC